MIFSDGKNINVRKRRKKIGLTKVLGRKKNWGQTNFAAKKKRSKRKLGRGEKSFGLSKIEFWENPPGPCFNELYIVAVTSLKKANNSGDWGSNRIYVPWGDRGF